MNVNEVLHRFADDSTGPVPDYTDDAHRSALKAIGDRIERRLGEKSHDPTGVVTRCILAEIEGKPDRVVSFADGSAGVPSKYIAAGLAEAVRTAEWPEEIE